jgi:hypothetical protein
MRRCRPFASGLRAIYDRQPNAMGLQQQSSSSMNQCSVQVKEHDMLVERMIRTRQANPWQTHMTIKKLSDAFLWMKWK